ncbi:hypothetical protein PybrP1_012787 [[Pythium] brassicae (nom. inval.)]|nr:hypothetical protein PybrP1_012787 [[Pythium] brassicae (nom. inval.)]
MDRFRLDDGEGDDFDSVAPMRPSSFNMSFTLASSHVAAAADAENDAAHSSASAASCTERDDENTTTWRAAGHTLLADEPRKHAAHAALADADAAAATAQKLEEKARETLALASLCGTVPWRLAKRHQDVHVYRPASLPKAEQNKLYFRISCEVKASLSTILEYLTPSDTKSYADIEAQVFPGLLHAAVVKRMELPEHSFPPPPPPPTFTPLSVQQQDEAAARDKDTASSYDDELNDSFPRLQVKWHASRFAGRFVKPVDFFFVEYANVETLPDGRKRGFGYLRSLESFKGDELATRLHSDDVAIPQSVSKCKRAVINKGIYLVSPSADAAGTYEVTFMLVIDFQQQFPSSVGAKIVQNFTDRLVGIRELLFNTLFQPVALVPKDAWKPARANKCAVCASSFSIVKLVHHCRACGEAVCSQCSRKWVVQPGAQKETLKRLCTPCSLHARSYLRGGEPAGGGDLRKLSATQSLDSSLRLTASATAAGARASARYAQDAVPLCDVKVASAVATDTNHFTAVSGAFYKLCASLGGVAPHFMVVSYSKEYDGNAVYDALAHCAPDTLFMGGTSSAGVFNELGSVGRGPGLALWGIYDPEGSYAVLNADLGAENPRDAARRCVVECMTMLCMEPEESPDFIWMGARTGSEEVLVATVNQVVDCAISVVGGSSARNHLGVSTIPATQICSEGSTVGCVTTHGACFAVCCPSVEVSRALFTCYTPKEKVFAVTKATNRDLVTIGHKPAFTALNDACHGMLYEFINRPESFNAETHTLPSFYPVARERKEVHGQQQPPRKSPTLQYHVIQPEHASRDMALRLGADVQLGERLRMMAIEPDSVKDKIGAGYREALRASLPALDATDVIGCLSSVGLCYSKILSGDLKVVAEASARAFPNAAVLGSVSHGQQGVFHGSCDPIHANSMITALLISNRKKLPKLRHLQPLSLRRISTF